MGLEIIEHLSGSPSPRPWSIIAGESGEGVIGDADGLDIAAASMADCVVIVRAVNDVDTLRSDLARVTAERDALRAEVEAMRGVVDAARGVVSAPYDVDVAIWLMRKALDALDALRARKVGE